MATKNKKTTNKVDLQKGWKQVKDTVKEVNSFVLETTEDVVDGVIKSGEQWQNVAVKATKGGLELTARQQDIIYETMDTMKKQWVSGRKKLNKIFS